METADYEWHYALPVAQGKNDDEDNHVLKHYEQHCSDHCKILQTTNFKKLVSNGKGRFLTSHSEMKVCLS